MDEEFLNVFGDDGSDLSPDDFDMLFQLTQLEEFENVEDWRNCEYGQDHPDWLAFCGGIKTGHKYIAEVNIFLRWVHTRLPVCETQADFDAAMVSKLKEYFVEVHDTEVDGNPKYAPNHFRPMGSIFRAFWNHSGKGELKRLAPIIFTNINHWEAGYEEKHAPSFEKDQILEFLNTRNYTADHLWWGAYCIIAKAYAARSGEPCMTGFEQLTRTVDENDVASFRLSFKRTKQRGKKSRGADAFCLIMGAEEVECLDRYIECFPKVPVASSCGTMNGRVGRLFRYLLPDGPLRFKSTVKPIGKNPCTQVGKNIATFLKLPDPDKYTGQCWRGTSASFCADAGLTTQQIMAVTGHKSEKALQVYVDNSKVQKQIAANAIAVGGGQTLGKRGSSSGGGGGSSSSGGGGGAGYFCWRF